MYKRQEIMQLPISTAELYVRFITSIQYRPYMERKGFRKGHVPELLIRSQHEKDILHSAMKMVVEQHFQNKPQDLNVQINSISYDNQNYFIELNLESINEESLAWKNVEETSSETSQNDQNTQPAKSTKKLKKADKKDTESPDISKNETDAPKKKSRSTSKKDPSQL